MSEGWDKDNVYCAGCGVSAPMDNGMLPTGWDVTPSTKVACPKCTKAKWFIDEWAEWRLGRMVRRRKR